MYLYLDFCDELRLRTETRSAILNEDMNGLCNSKQSKTIGYSICKFGKSRGNIKDVRVL